jgi:nicotinate phosphoribosyltransferase
MSIVVPRSIIDNDLYKLSMQQAVLALYPDVEAEYLFVNRRAGKDKFTRQFCDRLGASIEAMADLKLTDEEYQYMKSMPWFSPSYVEYLKNYRFDPRRVTIQCVDDNLQLRIRGPWRDAIWDEVPLMSVISELWFEPHFLISTNGCPPDKWNYDGQTVKAEQKAQRLLEAGAVFTDFGTRRRRSFLSQDMLVRAMSGVAQNGQYPGKFVGTSNVLLAMKYGLKPIGTMAHEWIQAHSVLGSLRHANRAALDAWVKVYHSALGTALTDTYTTSSFFEDFDPYYARLYDGIRHDSACPFKFTDNAVAHYHKLGIDPMSKTIIFSDSLDVDLAIKILRYCEGKIRCAFGIGTHFTNDFPGLLKALNMVIKLVKLGGVDVVKLSDDIRKAIGEKDAVRVARYVHCGIPLDAAMDTPFSAS